jgi:hypothetical protein
MKKNGNIIVRVSLFVVLGLLTASCSYRGAPSARAKAKFRMACAPMIQWLESEQRVRGSCPSELTPQYQSVLRGFPHPSHYRTHSTNTWFSISIGDYSPPSFFVYHYDSRHKQWFMDD